MSCRMERGGGGGRGGNAHVHLLFVTTEYERSRLCERVWLHEDTKQVDGGVCAIFTEGCAIMFAPDLRSGGGFGVEKGGGLGSEEKALKVAALW